MLESSEHPVGRLPQRKPTPGAAALADRMHQLAAGPRLAATPLLNFDGVGLPNYNGGSAPPDTVGAAGLTQYVQWVNMVFAVFDKKTGSIIYGRRVPLMDGPD